MVTQLEQQVAEYQHWRDELIAGIEAYHSWLEANGQTDIQQSLNIFDLAETLRQDRVVLAFLAEFSRGKTELINALFFADFKQRLLPSDVGRTTMCPTEIFYDPSEEPYIRLLPIETRAREESIATLKRSPVEWIKIKLNLDSPQDVANAMQSLAEVKRVSLDTARSLGLWMQSDTDTGGVVLEGDQVEIPSWRHALVNYPHPLLKHGLVILDTPGLNALGTEPELTLSMIPNAHAVLFLLAMDTGVTKSDLDVWQKYVEANVPRRLAVLNKIDLMWDELKPDQHIESAIDRQLDKTSETLNIPRDHVLAISAQKALVAKIRADDHLLEKSGIKRLEAVLANQIIPAKQEILREAVKREISTMIESSKESVMSQWKSAQEEIEELTRLSGKNRGVVKALLNKLESDKVAYQQTVSSFRNTYSVVLKQGHILLSSLDAEQVEEVLEKSRDSIEHSWTTPGLKRGMRALFTHFSEQSVKILNYANQIRGLVDAIYARFHEKYGFSKLSPPALSLERYMHHMRSLNQATEKFCNDPVNLLKEKRFVVKNFRNGLVTQARMVFERARAESNAWLKSALAPLYMQLREYEGLLERRVENIRKISDNLNSLEERIQYLEKLRGSLQQQVAELESIKTILEGKPSVEREEKVA